MVKLDKDTSEVFNRMHLLSKTSGGAPLNEADLAFVADMLRRPSFNKEQRENSGYGLLHIAAAGEHAGLVSFLVQNGVDVHGRSGAKGQGSSALYLAAQNMLQQALYSIVNLYAYATLSLSYTLFVLSIVRLYVIVTVTPQLPTPHLPSSASADSASAEVGNYWVQVFPHFFC